MQKKLSLFTLSVLNILLSTTSFAIDANNSSQQNLQQNIQQNATSVTTRQAEEAARLRQAQIDSAAKRTNDEAAAARTQDQQQAAAQLGATGGRASSTIQQVNATTANKTNQYNGTVNDTGGAYEQAQDGEKKADSGKEIGMAVGGAMTVGGGVCIAIGQGLIPNPFTSVPGGAMTAVGAVLVGMGAMELAQAVVDDDASKQAAKSQTGLKSFSPTNPIDSTYGAGDQKIVNTNTDPYNTDPNNSGPGNETKTTSTGPGSNTNNSNTGPNNTSTLAAALDQVETDMTSELAKHNIAFDKATKKITLPDGQSFTMDDLKKGKMPTSELQDAYKKAAATGADIAAQEISKLGLSGSANSALASGAKNLSTNKNDSLLSKIAADIKESGASGGAGTGDRTPAGGDSTMGLAAKGSKSATDAAALAAKANALAKVAGLSTNYNGEPIGVAADSIFEMVKRRYEMKDKENTFITDLLTVTTTN